MNVMCNHWSEYLGWSHKIDYNMSLFRDLQSLKQCVTLKYLLLLKDGSDGPSLNPKALNDDLYWLCAATVSCRLFDE